MRSLRFAALLAPLVAVAASCTAILGDLPTGSAGGGDGGPGTEGGGMGDGPQGDSPNQGDTGGSDSPKGDSSGGGDGGTEGGGIVSCGILGSGQRVVSGGDGGTISADKLYVYNASQTNVLALVRTSMNPSLAFLFRSDRPGDAPNVLPLQNGNIPADLSAVTRSADNTATYVFGNDNMGNLLLWNWPDGTGLNGTPMSATSQFQYQATTIQATGSGLFYASAMRNGPTDGGTGGGMGVYADYELATVPQLPNVNANEMISTAVDTGLGDGARLYALSDGSISLLYYASDITLHQAHFFPSMTQPPTDRQYYTGQIQPVNWQADGTGVDIAAAVPTNEAGTEYTLITGVVPESQLFTFDPSTTLKPIAIGSPITMQPCLASFPGKILVLVPDVAGMILYVIDVASHSIVYSLTGASTVLHSDTAIVSCALGNATFVGNRLNFELIWTDNVGNGQQNLNYAPLQCTTQ
jgi:hypothetical protein